MEVSSEHVEKQKGWDEIASRVENIRDTIGEPVDAGIKDTVIAFIALGFPTDGSCEGHLEKGDFAPWVDIKVPLIAEQEEQAKKLFEEADNERMNNKPVSETDEIYKKAHNLRIEARKPLLKEAERMMSLLGEYYKDHQAPHDIRLAIFPRLDTFRIESTGFFLQEGRSEDVTTHKLEEYKAEMKDFTGFLKNKYFSQK